MRKLISLLLVFLMVFSLVACSSNEEPTEPTVAEGTEATATTEAASTEKTVLNVWSFTDEVPKMIEKYLEMNPEFAAKYEIKTTIIATTEGAYQPALDQALSAGGADAPDLFTAESAFVLKYSQGDASQYAATYKELGIDVDAKIADAEIAQYTVDIGTNKNGDVVGLGYQATVVLTSTVVQSQKKYLEQMTQLKLQNSLDQVGTNSMMQLLS